MILVVAGLPALAAVAFDPILTDPSPGPGSPAGGGPSLPLLSDDRAHIDQPCSFLLTPVGSSLVSFAFGLVMVTPGGSGSTPPPGGRPGSLA